MTALYTILLLVFSNAFMTLAWYGHLKYTDARGVGSLPLIVAILISWGIALFEYMLQVPANRMGFIDNGGPFSLIQLKVIQEVLSIATFTAFTLIFFQNETFKWNHYASFLCLILAVFFAFKK